MGRTKRNHLIGWRIYGINESPTGEYTAQFKTTLPPDVYAAFLHYRRVNSMCESNAARMLIVHYFNGEKIDLKIQINSPTIKETMPVRTSLKGKLYKKVFSFWRENLEPTEADLIRMLIVGGLEKKGYVWR
jgi:hypothetical protein